MSLCHDVQCKHGTLLVLIRWSSGPYAACRSCTASYELHAVPGEMYSPPVQSVTRVYWCCRMSGDEYSTTLVPLCAMPNLCVSTWMTHRNHVYTGIPFKGKKRQEEGRKER